MFSNESHQQIAEYDQNLNFTSSKGFNNTDTIDAYLGKNVSNSKHPIGKASQ